MPLKIYFFFAIIAICFFSFQSCEKDNGPAPDLIPVVKPDTLGAGWTKKIMPGETNLNDVFFNSATTGFLIGAQIYKTTDAGNTWLSVSSSFETINAFMTNDGKAFFANNNFSILKTIDGGISFQNTSIAGNPSDIFFIDNNIGYCVTRENFIYNTIDGGIAWTKIITTGLPVNGNYSTLYCIDNATGWVATIDGIYKTMGTFSSWQQANVIRGAGSNFTSVHATSATNIYVGNERAEIFKSTDGGVNFSFVKKFGDEGLTDIHFFNDQVGYVCANRSIFKTIDAGLNWTKVVSLGQGYITEIHFADANHGWACGNNTILTFKQ